MSRWGFTCNETRARAVPDLPLEERHQFFLDRIGVLEKNIEKVGSAVEQVREAARALKWR